MRLPLSIMAVLILTTPAWPDGSLQPTQVQEVDNSLEGILKRLPPPPILDKLPEMGPLPPSRMEDIKPCSPELPVSEGGCQQATPMATLCPSDMVENAAGLCEWPIPAGADRERKRNAAEQGIQLPPHTRTIAPGQPAQSLICGSGLHFDEPSGRCRRDVPLSHRPPCKDTVTTVDGREIPYEEMKEAKARLYEKLTGLDVSGPDADKRVPTKEQVEKMHTIGIISVPCEGNGITVETDRPELLPQEFEGFKVISLPKVIYRLL